jgi:hypothetical protein
MDKGGVVWVRESSSRIGRGEEMEKGKGMGMSVEIEIRGIMKGGRKD